MAFVNVSAFGSEKATTASLESTAKLAPVVTVFNIFVCWYAIDRPVEILAT
jgi:hypothetical protein